MNYKVTVLIFLAISSGNDASVKMTKYEGKCKQHPNTKGYFTNIRFHEKNGVTYFDQSLKVIEEIPRMDKMLIFAKRCPSRDNLDYCENFRNVTVPGFGILAFSKGSPWSKRLTYVPPLTFPLKPGLYVANNTVVDKNWSVITSKGYWRNYAKIMSGDEVVVCVYAEGEILD